MRCPEAMERMYGYLDGEISPELEERIREHLKCCTRCCPEYDIEAAFLAVLRRQRESDRARAEFRARLVAAIRDRESSLRNLAALGEGKGSAGAERWDPRTGGSMDHPMNHPIVPGLEFDEDTVRLIEKRLSRLQDEIEGVRRALAEGRGCQGVQAEVFRLNETVTALASEVVTAHVETCVDQAVRAGETTLAVQTLRETLGRLLR